MNRISINFIAHTFYNLFLKVGTIFEKPKCAMENKSGKPFKRTFMV